MSRVIGVLSGKGGVGKTTLVSNLGASLTNDFNRNVLILDSNLRTSHLGLHLGVYDGFPVTLEDVLRKNVSPTYATFIHPETGIRILPAPLNASNVNIAKLKGAVKKLKKAYEMVIIDCSPGLGKEVVTVVKCIDEALLVTTPDMPAVTDVLKTITLLEHLKRDIAGIVVNRVRNVRYELKAREIEATCGHRVVAEIAEDDKIPESIANGMPVTLYAQRSKSAVALKRLSGYLLGEVYRAPSMWDSLRYAFNIERVASKVKDFRKKFAITGVK